MRASLLLCTFLSSAALFAAERLIHSDFEKDEAGWIVYGADSAHIRVTHTDVKTGTGALELDYEASSTKPAALVLPILQSLEKMQSVRFWMMADSAEAAAISLNEKTGGRYVALTWLQPHVWQRVELTPEDFILSTNPGDPADPDGKLDLDQIGSIAVLDVSQILNATFDQHGANIAVVTHKGPHKLFIDDFEVSPERPSWFHQRGKFGIDSFNHPQVDWFSLGGPELSVDTSGKVIAGNAMMASYQQTEEAFVLLAHEIPPSDFTGATHLAFDIASDTDTNILLVLEQRSQGNARFHAEIEVKGGGQSAHREIALSAFALDKQGLSDAAAQLDLTQLKSIALLDIAAAYTEQDASNTIRIGNMEFVKRAARPK